MIQYQSAEGISDRLYMWLVDALECGPSLSHFGFSFERATIQLLWEHRTPPLCDSQSGSEELVEDGRQIGQLSVPQEHQRECLEFFA
jgi:hypothetical protein